MYTLSENWNKFYTKLMKYNIYCKYCVQFNGKFQSGKLCQKNTT